MSNCPIEELNQSDKQTFISVLGGIYEDSPWVAAQTWSQRPFSTAEEVQKAMRDTVEKAPREKKIELLRAHPDLGENTEMTDASEREQTSAGLDQLSPELYAAFQQLNERYKDKFGFPFIMAVKDKSPDAIKSAMEARIENSKPEEFQTALTEVHKIAQLRIEELLISE